MEALANSIIKKQLCPVIKSTVEGTPNLKMMGIFSENRLQWWMTELACCSDSVTIVPIAVEQQFVNDERISNILNETELQTLCVSKRTIGVILDLKSKDMIKHLKNLIIYDHAEDLHITLATQVGFNIYQFNDLIREGYRMVDQPRQEPVKDTVLLIGITSGTTGEPKMAMLTHINFISGQVAADFLGIQFD